MTTLGLPVSFISAQSSADVSGVWVLDSRATRDAVGDDLTFLRASLVEGSPPSLDARLEQLRAVVPGVGEIHVRVGSDLSNLTVSCPAHDCRIVAFQSGIQTGTHSLVRGSTAILALDAEVRIEPASASPTSGRLRP